MEGCGVSDGDAKELRIEAKDNRALAQCYRDQAADCIKKAEDKERRAARLERAADASGCA
jgi:hypothetical protein